MEAAALHMATALESVMASDAAESYHRQLVAERDRWKLLLDINNHVIAFLDVNGRGCRDAKTLPRRTSIARPELVRPLQPEPEVGKNS